MNLVALSVDLTRIHDERNIFVSETICNANGIFEFWYNNKTKSKTEIKMKAVADN